MAEAKYNTPEEFENGRELLRQAKQEAEDLHVRERELREPLDSMIQKVNEKIGLLESNYKTGNSEFLAVLAEADAHAEKVEADLRAAMLAKYNGDPEKGKQIATGLSIRVDKKYEYEEEKAIAFAIERKMPEVLALDKTKFKKLMTIQPQDFVTVTDVPTPVISLKK